VKNGPHEKFVNNITPDCFLPHICYQFDQVLGPNIHAGFVYLDTVHPSFGLLYALPEKEFLRAFRYFKASRHVEETPFMTAPIRPKEGMPGGALFLSSNRGRDAILWVSVHEKEDATDTPAKGTLFAVDALSLQTIWKEDDIAYFAKFQPPIVADGKVYLVRWGGLEESDRRRAVRSAIVVYGLR